MEKTSSLRPPGTRASELYAKVTEAIRKGGLPQYKCTLAGIGIEPRDYPILGAPMKISSPFMGAPFDPEIRAGMVLNIETPLNILTQGSFQYEVTLLVENDGGRLLSRRRSYDAVWPS
jgi:Xaa-Pro aminopeptidase